MKKISTIVISSLMALCAGQALAQEKVTQAPVTAMAKPAATPTGAKPLMPTIKDFKAARDLELERVKFNQAQSIKLEKCLEVAKVSADIYNCQNGYREGLTEQLKKLMAEGKFAAAYETSKLATPAPSTVPAPARK